MNLLGIVLVSQDSNFSPPSSTQDFKCDQSAGQDLLSDAAVILRRIQNNSCFMK